MATVARISIAPIKALGLAHPDSVDVAIGGVRGDRRFWLVDEAGRLFNGKRNGPMVGIRPEWDEETRELALAFPDGTRVEGVVELGPPTTAQLYGRPHASRPVQGPWQDAISSYVGQSLTLLWSEAQAIDRGGTGGEVSLVSRASLRRLREEADAPGPVDGRRFRMSFEIEGVDAHTEDEWIGSSVRIGSTTVRFNGDVGRCVVTSQHPDTGVVDLDTLGTLAKYRPDGRNEPLPFGVYGSVTTPGRVRIGDPVDVLAHS
jgi:uncharacterized protein YcbX